MDHWLCQLCLQCLLCLLCLLHLLQRCPSDSLRDFWRQSPMIGSCCHCRHCRHCQFKASACYVFGLSDGRWSGTVHLPTVLGLDALQLLLIIMSSSVLFMVAMTLGSKS